MGPSQKVIWITGASSGIGKALALEYIALGNRVIVSGRNKHSLEELRALNPQNVEVLAFDVSDEHARQQALNELKPIDIFIYSVGLSQRSWAIDTRLSTVKTLMEVNFFGAVDLAQGLLSQKKLNHSGQLVIVSSVVGHVGTPKRSAYAATKHALHGYFNTIRSELKSQAIDVTILCPGYIETGIDTRSLLGDGTPQGSRDTNRSKGHSPEKFAQEAVKAISKRKLEAYIGGVEVYAIYLQRFLPRLVAKLQHRFSPEAIWRAFDYSGTIHFYKSRSPGKKILLIPGLTSPLEVFLPLIKELEGRGFEVLSLDLPGLGPSINTSSPQSLDNLSAEISGLLKYVGWSEKNFELVGFSWGAGLATKVGLESNGKVSKLFLISPIGLKGGFPLARQVLKLPCIGSKLLIMDFIRSFTHPELHSNFISKFKLQIKQKDFKAGLGSSLKNTGLEFEALYQRLTHAQLKVSVIAGKQDPKLQPLLLEKLNGWCSGYEEHLLPGQKHMLPLEAAHTVADIISQGQR